MPRTGKGQKIATATGQEYGQAKAQADAQSAVPIAAAPPTLGAANPLPAAPGAAAFNRPTERPNEPGTVSGTVRLPSKDDTARRYKAAMQLPIIESMASQPGAPPHLRNSVRKLKAFIGDVSEFADRKP